MFSSFSGNSIGVAILFNKNFEYKLYKMKTDNSGDFIIIEREDHTC